MPTPQVRHVGGFRGRSVDVDVLRALARLSQRDAVPARELAAVLGRPVQAVTPKVLSLVKAGLAARDWGPEQIQTGSYTITGVGHDYLRRLDDRERRSRCRMTAQELKGKLVLVADDDASIRMICRVNFEAEGLEVVEATDGPQALELARREQPAVILLDVMLPGLDGFQVAHDLLADPDTAKIPIVFLSGRADHDAQVRGLQLGGIDYVTKPFDPLELATTLLRIVREDPREWETDRRARLEALQAARRLDERAPRAEGGARALSQRLL